jgi:hypothetical protein
MATQVPNRMLAFDGGSFAFRNRIINGNFLLDQRGGGALVTYNGGSSTTETYKSADRWAMIAASGQIQLQRIANTDTPEFIYALRVRRPVGSTDINGLYVGQIIENANCLGLQGKPLTISFYARRGSSFTGTNNTFNIEIWTGTNTDDRTWVNLTNNQWLGQSIPLCEIPVLSTSWQKYSYTLNSLATNVRQIGVRFFASQTGTSTANDYFDIAQVQLEEGSVATPFEERSAGIELTLCQRYYHRQVWLNQDTNPSLCVSGYIYTQTQWEGQYYFPVEMRIPPFTFTHSGTSHFQLRYNPQPNSVSDLFYYRPSARSALIGTTNSIIGSPGIGTGLQTAQSNPALVNVPIWFAFHAEL